MPDYLLRPFRQLRYIAVIGQAVLQHIPRRGFRGISLCHFADLWRPRWLWMESEMEVPGAGANRPRVRILQPLHTAQYPAGQRHDGDEGNAEEKLGIPFAAVGHGHSQP